MATVANSWLPRAENVVKEIISWVLTDSMSERHDRFEKEHVVCGLDTWSNVLKVLIFPDDCQNIDFNFNIFASLDWRHSLCIPSSSLLLLKLDSLSLSWSHIRWDDGLFTWSDNGLTGNRIKDLSELVKIHPFADIPNSFCLEHSTFYKGCKILALLWKKYALMKLDNYCLSLVTL